MAERIGRAVLELGINGPALSQEFGRAKSDARGLDAEFEKLRQRSQGVGQELRRMVEGFQGRALVDQARNVVAAVNQVGGASTLTAKELKQVSATLQEATAKMVAMGDTVPPSMAKLTAEVKTLEAAGAKAAGGGLSSMGGALTSLKTLLPAIGVAGALTFVAHLGADAIESAGQLTDMSRKLDISTDALQEMRAVANQTGSSLEAFTNAAFKLGINISEGSSKARSAVGELGLSYDALRAKRPEDQFREIVKALEGLDNVQDRNRIGFALFGKTFGEIAPGIADGYTRIADAAHKATREQLDDLDQLGDDWQQFKDDFGTAVTQILGSAVRLAKGLGTGIKDLTPEEQTDIALAKKNGQDYAAVIERIRASHEAAAAAKKADAAATAGATTATRDYVAELAAVRARLAELTPAQRAQIDAALKLEGASEALGRQYGLSEDELRLYESATKSTTTSVKSADDATAAWNNSLAENATKAREAAKDVAAFIAATNQKITAGASTQGDLTKELEKRTGPLAAAIQSNATKQIQYQNEITRIVQERTLERTDFQIAEIQRWAANEKLTLDHAAGDWETNAALIDQIAAERIDQIRADADAAFAEFARGAEEHVSKFREALRTKLGPAIIGAFQGGGNVGKSIGGLLGNEISTSLLGEIGKGGIFSSGLGKVLQSGLGKTLGGFAASLVPGLGALLGGLGGSLLGKLFGGPSPAVQKARQDVAAFQADLAKTLTVQQRTAAGGEQWRQTLVKVRDAYLATGRSAADAEAIVKQLFDTNHPERAAAAMKTINDVLKEQADRLEENKGKAQSLFDEIIQAGSEGIPDAFRPAIEQLISLGLLTDEQAAKLRGLGDSGAVNVDKMRKALDVFKGRVESLGPAFKQAEINQTATEYINAIETMTKGGGDLGMILEDSKEELSALVEDALKSGKTLPANMQPWIDQLFRQGDLIDKNGKKITDLSGLKYGDAIKTEGQKAQETWEKILAKIQELVDKITGPLTGAINNLPDGHVKIHVDDSELDRAGRPRDYRSGERPSGTGFVDGIVRGRFSSAGTLSYLHGIESVVPQAQELNFAAGVLAERGLSITQATTTNATGIVGIIMGQGLSPWEIGRQATEFLAKRGIPNNTEGVARSVERLVDAYLRTSPAAGGAR